MTDIYTLYNSQNFYSFPHNDCDQRTTDELVRIWFSSTYYCAYSVERISRVISAEECLSALQALPWFGQLGAAFMRMKFLLEVCDPALIARKKVPRMNYSTSVFQKAPINKIWEHENYIPYIKMDNFCNRLFTEIIDTIDRVGNQKNKEEPSSLVKAATTLNATLPSMRRQFCTLYTWSDVAPQHLAAFPYFMFVVNSWSVVGPILEDLTSSDPIHVSS